MQSFTLAVLRVAPFLSILSILWFLKSTLAVFHSELRTPVSVANETINCGVTTSHMQWVVKTHHFVVLNHFVGGDWGDGGT